jgi:acyl dehydratase
MINSALRGGSFVNIVNPDEVKHFVGTQTGLSDWIAISQDLINQFADVTDDHQPIHVDPQAASKTLFGGTVAHGFLTLSLLPKMARSGVVYLEGLKMGVNYGFDKVRFLNPVKSGKRIRGRFTLVTADQKIPGQWSFRYAVRVEIEGEDKPALLADWLSLQYV